MQNKIRVTIWNEFIHEREHDAVAKIYPQGIHQVVANALQERLGNEVSIRVATLGETEHGLTDRLVGASGLNQLLSPTSSLAWKEAAAAYLSKLLWSLDQLLQTSGELATQR